MSMTSAAVVMEVTWLQMTLKLTFLSFHRFNTDINTSDSLSGSPPAWVAIIKFD